MLKFSPSFGKEIFQIADNHDLFIFNRRKMAIEAGDLKGAVNRDAIGQANPHGQAVADAQLQAIKQRLGHKDPFGGQCQPIHQRAQWFVGKVRPKPGNVAKIDPVNGQHPAITAATVGRFDGNRVVANPRGGCHPWHHRKVILRRDQPFRA